MEPVLKLRSLFMVKCHKCPNCGMPLTDEMSCDYGDWKNRKK